MKLRLSPHIGRRPDDTWSVKRNPTIDFAAIREYFESCVEPDSPIDPSLLISDLPSLAALFNLLRGTAQNDVHQRGVHRLGQTLRELALGHRIIVTHRVPWRFLPPGHTGVVRAVAYFRHLHQLAPDLQIDEERLRFMESMCADQTFLGQDSFDGYICFYFAQKQVALLECPIYGNALYILKHDWETLSRHSKTELLTRFSDSIACIRHTTHFTWQVRQELSKLGVSTNEA